MTNYSNIADDTTLDADINDTVKTLDVISATGYPDVDFNIEINYDNPAGMEVINVGNKASLTFSLLRRGHDGTTAKSHSAGAKIRHAAVAEDMSLTEGAPTEGDTVVWSVSGPSKIWVYDTDANDGLFNGPLGLGGEAADGDTVLTSQSSTFAGLVASNALDVAIDITTGRSHTESEPSPWWQVEFLNGAVFDWTHFAIRAQAHANAFEATQLSIQGRDPVTQSWSTYDTSTTDPGNGAWIDYTISGLPTVDGIKIQASDTNFLVLGSVEAWGTWYPNGKRGAWIPTTTSGMFDLLHSKKSAPDIPDDEFSSTTLDPKWTLVDGASGTVDLLLLSDTSIYDLTTRSGQILFQVGDTLGEDVQLRQDFTLGDGESIIAAIGWSYPLIASNAPGDIGNNDLRIGIGLNDTDTAPDDGDYMFMSMELDDGEMAVQVHHNTTADNYVEAVLPDAGPQGVMFYRIDRLGTDYVPFVSFNNGRNWTFLGESTFTNGLWPAPGGTPYNNLWLFCDVPSTFDQVGPRPILSVDWIRLGTSTLDPWNPIAAVAVSPGAPVPGWMSALADRTYAGEGVHAYDDEFDDGTFAPEWVETTVSGTATWTETRHRANVAFANQTVKDAVSLLKPLDSLSFPLTIETTTMGLNYTGTNTEMGLMFTDGTASGSNTIHALTYAGLYGIWSGTLTTLIATNHGQDSVRMADIGMIYLRHIWSAADSYKSQISRDGFVWLDHSANTVSKTLTPTHFGIWVSSDGNSARTAVFEYFRVTEADLSL